MANKEYYDIWLKIKERLERVVESDESLQELAKACIGFKPQSVAVEVVAKVYCAYCELFNRLCEYYDQTTQVQRREHIKKLIDTITCRIIELKNTFEDVEVFQFTYPDNTLQAQLMVPQDIQVLCPFFYSYETREQEMQYVVDQIMAGNRIGDPEPTPSELERREEERLEEERKIREEKEAEIKRKLAMGEDIVDSEPSIILSPEELETIRFVEEYNRHLFNIQKMERSRQTVRELTHKANKDANVYLELAGLKAPPPREDLRDRAVALIQRVFRTYMQAKRDKIRDDKEKIKLGMVIPSWSPPSAKIQLERVRAERRKFRQDYYIKWLKANVNEKSRVMRLREGDIMEDISEEVRQWFLEWYKEVQVFDEYPWPEEGGSILIVRGETFTIEEYIEWKIQEDKKALVEPKSKEEIKAEKLAAKMEKKRLEMEAIEREKKRLADYKKQRLNPENDPGIYISIGKNFEPLRQAWLDYQNLWRDIDRKDPHLDAVRGYIMDLVTDNAYSEVQLELRPIVDEMMRLELALLKVSLKNDCLLIGISKPPQSKKRPKPKKKKVSKPDKRSPASLFQELVDEGIIIKYTRIYLDDYWGDQNYAAADLRAIPWTPSFPGHTIGDVRELVRVRCVLSMCATCSDIVRAQMLVGPESSGKRTLVNAIATETNSIMMDLSPMNVYDKYPGPKNLKRMFQLVNKVSRLMQPTVILIENVEKTFYKRVPKEEKIFDPTRLQKDFFKELVKPLTNMDKILIIGTSSVPWNAKPAQMQKAFPSLILLPRSDYGSIVYVLSKLLMKYHGVSREFNYHSVAQALRGYDINAIKKGVENLMTAARVAKLAAKPLSPEEVLQSVLDIEDAHVISEFDYTQFKDWYESYSPWGSKYLDYKFMLDTQLQFKIKNEKKK